MLLLHVESHHEAVCLRSDRLLHSAMSLQRETILYFTNIINEGTLIS